MSDETETVEIADVLAFAAEQRRWAERVRNPESDAYVPFAEPYAPSDKRALNLCSEMGPKKALAYLKVRADGARADLKREQEADRVRLERERKRRTEEERDRVELATKKTPGRRVDAAITHLRLIAGGKTAKLDKDGATTGKAGSVLLLDDGSDPVGPAVRKALRLARDLEGQVETLRRRKLPPSQVRDRDERLRQSAGYSPEDLSRVDPAQGLPRQIRERRSALGLDEETGAPILGEAA